MIRRTHVIIEYCEPIYMDSMERAEKKKIGEKVRQIISDKIKRKCCGSIIRSIFVLALILELKLCCIYISGM